MLRPGGKRATISTICRENSLSGLPRHKYLSVTKEGRLSDLLGGVEGTHKHTGTSAFTSIVPLDLRAAFHEAHGGFGAHEVH